MEEKRASIPDTSPRVLLATGSYLGEGFDDARLDTLFLALPISTISGLPSNVSLIREKRLDEKYSETVRRILREGVSPEEFDLFVFAAEAMQQENPSVSATVDDELARSAVERFFFRHLESTSETKCKFALNARLPIPFV